MALPLSTSGANSAAPASVRRPEIVFFPLPSPGHYIPMFDIAALLASRGANATVVVNSVMSTSLAPSVFRAAAAGLTITLYVLPFPSDAAGLPDGVETADAVPAALSHCFGVAVALLQGPFSKLLLRLSPDAVVADALLPWTAQAAAAASIPWYSFPGTGVFALSVDRSLTLNPPDVNKPDPFLVPDLPDEVKLTVHQLKETTLPGQKTLEFFNLAREAEQLTAGIVVNSFPELEPRYVDHYEREVGKALYLVGPVSLVGLRCSHGGRQVINWLEKRPARSVIYVCFGSLCRLPEAQLVEIGRGLEDSGVAFLWVVRDSPSPSPEVAAEVAGVEVRVGERGMVVRGWVEGQGELLGHKAIGGFMTHCGWGAVTEAAAMGVPVLTWPMFAEQFYNEKLATEVTGIGAAMGAEKGFVWGEEAAKIVVGRERIKERVKWFMAGTGDREVEGIREKARQMGERAKRAAEEGGSSYAAAERLLEDIQRRSPRANGHKFHS